MPAWGRKRSRTPSREAGSGADTAATLRAHLAARALAEDTTALPLGILYHNPDAPRYDLMSAVGLEMTAEQRLAGLNEALDHFAI